MPTPVIFISSWPESTTQEPPHKLIHHTTDRNSVFFVLDFPGTIHPIDHNLVVSPKPPNDDVYLMAMQHSRDHCRHVVLFERSTGSITSTPRLRWFQVQHGMPRLLKPFRQCQTLSPCVTGLQLRYPGVTPETRKRAFPIIRSAKKRTFPTACCCDSPP